MFLHRLRQMMSRDVLVLRGAALQAASTAAMAFTSNIYVAVLVMFLGGVAWISTANTLSVAAQLALPDWVRARGMSMYQMAIMGGSAAGAALWGQVANVTDVRTSLAIAAVTGVLGMWLVQRWVRDDMIEEDHSRSTNFNRPANAELPEAGRILITIEYFIDPQRAAEFRAVMQESRRSRLRQGALSWQLQHDIAEPSRYIEQIVDESWTEHLRRFDRVTTSDVSLRDRKIAFHVGDSPPAVSRYVVER